MKKIISIHIAAIAMAICLISCTKEEPMSIMIDYYVGGNCIPLVDTDPCQAFTYKNNKVFLTYPKGYTLKDLTCTGTNANNIYSCGYTTDADGRHPAIMKGENAYNSGFEAEIGEFNFVRRLSNEKEEELVALGYMIRDDKKQGVLVHIKNQDKKVVFTCPEEDSCISAAIYISEYSWILCGTAGDHVKLWHVNTKDFSLEKSQQISPSSATDDYSYEVNGIVYSGYYGLAAAITRTEKANGKKNVCLWRESGSEFKVLDTNMSFAKGLTIYNSGILVYGATMVDSNFAGAIWQDGNVYSFNTKSYYFTAINSQGFFHTMLSTPGKVNITISNGYSVQSTEYEVPENFEPCVAGVTYTQQK